MSSTVTSRDEAVLRAVERVRSDDARAQTLIAVAKEAGISRGQLYRCEVLEDVRQRLASSPPAADSPMTRKLEQTQADLAAANSRLKATRSEVVALRTERDTYANLVYLLDLQLRQSAGGKKTPIPLRKHGAA
jgi:hypothetical protein